MVTIELSETKDAYEIVEWRFANQKSIEQIKNRARREGGQVLVTKSNTQGSSDLHDLSSDTGNIIPASAEKSSAFVMRDGETLKNNSVDADGNKVEMTLDEYQKNKRSMPLYLATAHGQQTPLLQAAVAVSDDNISPVEKNATAENENSEKMMQKCVPAR